jgi:hypothetical protein
MPDFSLTGPDGQSYNVTAESSDLAQKALDYEFANKGPTQATPPASAPETRSFGSMLSGLIPGMGPGGWGPQNWHPPGYNAADAAVHDATSGLSDIARGYVRDLRDRISPPTDFGGGGDYPTQTEQGGGLDIKNERDRFAAEHPYASTGAKLAGGAAGGLALPIGRGIEATRAISDPALRRLTQWGGGIGLGAGLGGVGGGLDEAPEGLWPALEGVGKGGTIGAAVGAVATPIGAGVGRLARRVGDYFAAAPARAELGVGQPAVDAVQRGLASDAAFAGGQGAGNIARAGPYGMPADAGPTTAGMLDEAISSGGPGALTGRNAVTARGTAAKDTLNTALDSALGPPIGVETAQLGINAAGKPVRQAAYEAAYNKPIDYSSPGGRELEELLKRAPRAALEHANEMMRNKGYVSRQILADVADDGTVTYRSVPDMLQVDYIKRGIQQLAKTGEGTGMLGGRSDIGASRMGLASEIRDKARDLVPEYGHALRVAGDDIGQVEAVQFGANLLSSTVPRDVARREIAAMSPHDRAAMMQGIRSNIDDQVANVRNYVSNPNYDAKQASAALKDLNSQQAREKLAMVVTDPAQLAALQREIEIATSSAELVANMAANSKTAGRGVTREARQTAGEPGAVGSALEFRPWQALQRFGQMFTGRTPQENLAAQDRVGGEIADLLTRQRDPATGRSVVDAIEGILPGLARSGERSRALSAIPGIMLPPEVEAARQYMQPGPPGRVPIPRGVLPP